MEIINKKYNKLLEQSSDINEHLPTLLEYARKCNHITEMGVRWCVSSYAFLSSNPRKMISYDIETHPNVRSLIAEAKDAGIDFTYIEADTREVSIEETDLLFLDTEHSYNQLKAELTLHADKAKKYIILHDTVTFASPRSDGLGGLSQAVEEWLEVSPEWELDKHFSNNNGLTIYKRK